MNNVERMIDGLRYCAEAKTECRGAGCPLYEMCITNGLGLAGALGIAAEMLEILQRMGDEWKRRAEDAEARHRTEYCEAGPYDCVTLGKLRAELDLVKRERDAAVSKLHGRCDLCKHLHVVQRKSGSFEFACDFENCQGTVHRLNWEWAGVQEVQNDA